VARSSRLREIAGLGVVALALAAAGLIVAGPALLAPEPVPALPQPIARAERDASSEAPAGAAASQRGPVRARPIAVPGQVERTDTDRGDGDHLPHPVRAAQQARSSSANGLRGPLTQDRIARAIDRAVRRGWLTIDPPGSEPRGMALFPPLGTQPLKQGIVVPEGYELPPGYVRHYQVTDAGEQLRAILMFSPDYEWVDDRGEIVPLPPDRIVPPDMAPEGMPVERLELPPPTPSWP
jgi:hypothetical protein